MITGIIIGVFIGAPLGVMVEALCLMAGRESRKQEQERENDKSGIY